jgi:hypothetical protein
MNLFRKLFNEAGETSDAGQGAAPTDSNGAAQGAGAGTATPADKPAEGQAKPAEGAAKPADEAKPAEPVKPAWPDNWRQIMSGGDEKMLKQLERYSSPNDVWAKAKTLETDLSSGKFKSVKPFPDKGTPEEQTAWRAENGIPEAPDKYDIKLGEGIVIGEADKPLIDDFLKFAHAKNVPQAEANAAVQWYFDFAERQAQERHDADMQAKQTFEDTMRAEWGPEYRPNINAINAIMDMGPKGLKDRLLQGRLADGTPLGSDPDFLRLMSNIARTVNPVTTLTPGAGANMAQAIADELTTLKGLMADRSSEYWKGPKAEKNQARYRELVDAQKRHK